MDGIYNGRHMKIRSMEYISLFILGSSSYDLLLTGVMGGPIKILAIEKINIHFFRTPGEINNVNNKIMEYKPLDIQTLFQQKDIFISGGINSAGDLYTYAEHTVLKDYGGSGNFIAECR